jgi:PAS domain S-box-containing protein
MLKETLNTLESAMKELLEINNALDEALIVAMTDQRGTITFANKKFCEISKYSREELLGQNHRIINSGYHSKEFFKDMWRTIANGKIWRGELRNKAKDGSFYWMDTTIVPCLDEHGKPYQYVSFRIDITERKRVEEYLRRMEKNQTIANMASGIAHEIRNPLAAIKWAIKFVQSEGISHNNKKNDEYFDTIISEINRIDLIVGELLSISKPHSQGILFERTDIVDSLEKITEIMRPQATKHNVNFVMDIQEEVPDIDCQENQLKQVFINIIKNSIEAMPNGGNLMIRVQRKSKDFIELRFIDEGYGIPQDQISSIGEPFFTTKESGTGLGMMISKKIIEEHNGHLSIESKLNYGTTVIITLPINQDQLS